MAIILVGPRPDGSIPSRDEQKALAGVAEPIARAVRTVIKREAREGQVADLIAANARRIDDLEAMLGAARGCRTETLAREAREAGPFRIPIQLIDRVQIER